MAQNEADYAAKLKEQGVSSKKALLEKGATRKGRADLAEKSGISERLILAWVNKADLFRIKGIGTLGAHDVKLIDVKGDANA